MRSIGYVFRTFAVHQTSTGLTCTAGRVGQPDRVEYLSVETDGSFLMPSVDYPWHTAQGIQGQEIREYACSVEDGNWSCSIRDNLLRGERL